MVLQFGFPEMTSQNCLNHHITVSLERLDIPFSPGPLTIAWPCTVGVTHEDRALGVPFYYSNIYRHKGKILGLAFCLVLWVLLCSQGQGGSCFMWLKCRVEESSCGLAFWLYSSVSAGESLAANPDRKLVREKSLVNVRHQNKTENETKLQLFLYKLSFFFFLNGKTLFQSPHSKNCLFNVTCQFSFGSLRMFSSVFPWQPVQWREGCSLM